MASGRIWLLRVFAIIWGLIVLRFRGRVGNRRMGMWWMARDELIRRRCCSFVPSRKRFDTITPYPSLIDWAARLISITAQRGNTSRVVSLSIWSERERTTFDAFTTRPCCFWIHGTALLIFLGSHDYACSAAIQALFLSHSSLEHSEYSRASLIAFSTTSC
jgi:hypothetical protein